MWVIRKGIIEYSETILFAFMLIRRGEFSDPVDVVNEIDLTGETFYKTIKPERMSCILDELVVNENIVTVSPPLNCIPCSTFSITPLPATQLHSSSQADHMIAPSGL